MRIVHVVWSLNIGGQERFILNLSRALAAMDHDVSVIAMTAGGALRPQFEGIEVVDVLLRGFAPAIMPRLALRLSGMKPDVVHTHNMAPLMYGAVAARAARARRVVHTKHGATPDFSPRARFLARAAVYAVDAFAAVSDGTADVARELERVPERKLHVVPNGVPLDQFGADPEARRRVRAELGIPDDAVVVGTVGRLVEEKDHPFLVRAIAPHLSSRTRLVIVGDGKARGAIDDTIARHVAADRRSFIHLTGARSDVPALLASFDVFALSSRTEGLPLVVPEAMASRLPVIATRVGGLPGIVPPTVGRLVDHGDDRGLRDAIAELIGSPETRRTLGEAAYAYAHGRFSLARMTEDYLRLYAGD
jgi:glycosyltransferase involved in cell wall biosynthesis